MELLCGSINGLLFRLGSMWTACFLSVFQLLSEDYISYVFFSIFVGIAVGAVQVIAVPFVIEMVRPSTHDVHRKDVSEFQFPVELRAIFGLLLTAAAFLFNLALPGMAFAIKNWKILQGVVSAPIVLTGILYWYVNPRDRLANDFSIISRLSIPGGPKNRCFGTPHRRITLLRSCP